MQPGQDPIGDLLVWGFISLGIYSNPVRNLFRSNGSIHIYRILYPTKKNKKKGNAILFHRGGVVIGGTK